LSEGGLSNESYQHLPETSHNGPFPVFSFSEYVASRSVEDFVIDLFCLSRETVQELPIRLGARLSAEFLGNLESFEGFETGLLF
jgi:hypothetical protein